MITGANILDMAEAKIAAEKQSWYANDISKKAVKRKQYFSLSLSPLTDRQTGRKSEWLIVSCSQENRRSFKSQGRGVRPGSPIWREKTSPRHHHKRYNKIGGPKRKSDDTDWNWWPKNWLQKQEAAAARSYGMMDSFARLSLCWILHLCWYEYCYVK